MICGDEMKDLLDISEFVDDKINHQGGKIMAIVIIFDFKYNEC